MFIPIRMTSQHAKKRVLLDMTNHLYNPLAQTTGTNHSHKLLAQDACTQTHRCTTKNAQLLPAQAIVEVGHEAERGWVYQQRHQAPKQRKRLAKARDQPLLV